MFEGQRPHSMFSVFSSVAKCEQRPTAAGFKVQILKGKQRQNSFSPIIILDSQEETEDLAWGHFMLWGRYHRTRHRNRVWSSWMERAPWLSHSMTS